MTDLTVRQCGTCLRWHQIASPRVTCAVMHPEGTCCHYGDREVPGPELDPAAFDFTATGWTPEQVAAFEREWERAMSGGVHRTRIFQSGTIIPVPCVHIAGAVAQVGSHLRQRCSWCGKILIDCDLTRIAVLEGDDPRPSTWETGALVRVDGNASFVVEHEDGADVPGDCCAAVEIGPQAEPDGSVTA